MNLTKTQRKAVTQYKQAYFSMLQSHAQLNNGVPSQAHPVLVVDLDLIGRSLEPEMIARIEASIDRCFGIGQN